MSIFLWHAAVGAVKAMLSMWPGRDFQVEREAAVVRVWHRVQLASVPLWKKHSFHLFSDPTPPPHSPFVSCPPSLVFHILFSSSLIKEERKRGGKKRARLGRRGRMNRYRDDSSLWFNLNRNAREPHNLCSDRGQGGAGPRTQPWTHRHRYTQAEKGTCAYLYTKTKSREWK